MLRKFAVALLAATVLGAPAFAQAPSTPKTDSPSAAATTTAPKAVAAKPALKSAKVKKSKRHLAHVKRAKRAHTAQSVPGTKHHVRHVVSKPAPTVGSGAVSTAKSKSGAN